MTALQRFLNLNLLLLLAPYVEAIAHRAVLCLGGLHVKVSHYEGIVSAGRTMNVENHKNQIEDIPKLQRLLISSNN